MVDTIELKGECNIYQISDKHSQLLEAVKEAEEELVISIKGIEAVDTSFVQLLACVKEASVQNDLKLSIKGASKEVQEFFGKLHCHELLEC